VRNENPSGGEADNGASQARDEDPSGTEKMEAPTITNSVNIVESGKIEEIIGASDAYQLYVVRLTAQSDDTKVEAFNVLNWSDFTSLSLRTLCLPAWQVSRFNVGREVAGSNHKERGDFTGE
jgi:hypothetical protein